MKTLDRIERSATRKGEYVGYCQGGVQRIRKRGTGGWETYALGSSHGKFVFFHAQTLEAMDGMMRRYAEAHPLDENGKEVG